MTLWLFGLMLTFYFALHSFLAAEKVKDLLIRYVVPGRYYRLLFNILAVLLLLPLVWGYIVFDKSMLLSGWWWMIPGVLLIATGLRWVTGAFKRYDMDEFMGLDQLRNDRSPDHSSLETEGLNARTRHPLYFGTLLIFWGAFLCLPNDAALLIAILSTIYLFVGASLEEKKLEQQFGEAYRLYQKQVPMILPFSWKSWKK